METKYDTLKNLMIILLLLGFNSHAQNANVSTNDDAIIGVDQPETFETLQDFTAYLFFNSTIDGRDFNYRKALRASREHPKTITVDTLEISSTTLLKVFKKAANRAEDYDIFKAILIKKLKMTPSALTDAEAKKLYESFRVSTFNGYLDEVRLAFGTHL